MMQILVLFHIMLLRRMVLVKAQTTYTSPQLELEILSVSVMLVVMVLLHIAILLVFSLILDLAQLRLERTLVAARA